MLINSTMLSNYGLLSKSFNLIIGNVCVHTYLSLSGHPVVDVLLYLGCVSDDRSMAWVQQRGGQRVQSVKGPQVATKILEHLFPIGKRGRERADWEMNEIMILCNIILMQLPVLFSQLLT